MHNVKVSLEILASDPLAYFNGRHFLTLNMIWATGSSQRSLHRGSSAFNFFVEHLKRD